MDIKVKGDVIRLGQFLKMADFVSTGGEAKIRIQSGEIKVNGQVETRRGRQLKDGDQVESEDGRLCTVRLQDTPK